MKKAEEMQQTSNSRVQRLLGREYQRQRRCWYCAPGRGCNYIGRVSSLEKNWKSFRRNQWKEVGDEI